MLTRLQLRNYRCIRQADVTLSPLTVLVGPNSSGKSSLLNALRPGQYDRYRIEDVWQHDPALTWAVQHHFEAGHVAEYLRGTGDKHKNAALDFEYQLVHFDINSLRNKNHVTRMHRMSPDGGNLTNMFASLKRPQHADIAAQLGVLVPSFRDVAVEPAQEPGYQTLKFQDRWNEKVWYPPSEVSDGTMLVTAYLVLQHQDPPVDLIAIEEPERGLHPYLLGELVSLWRKMTRGELGPRPIQIILATHSAELLDHVDPSEVRFMSRDGKTGEVRIEQAPLATDDWRQAYRAYQDSLGSMWLSGGLGGVPGS